MEHLFVTFVTYLLYTSLSCYNCCPPNGYTFCSNKTATCSGIGMVSYGNDGTFAYQSSTGSASCRNAHFGGSPIIGTKKCCILSPELSGPSSINKIVNTISCGETVNGFLKDVNDVHYYKLTTTISGDITYSLCGTGFDSSLTIYNDIGTKISDAYCDAGDDCGFCPYKRTEIFTITNQNVGTYYIRVQYYSTSSTLSLGTQLYKLAVACPPTYSIINPFESWTQKTTPPMTMSDKSGLMTGYDANTNRIWLVGGVGDEIWYYDIDTNTFTSRGNLPLVMDNLNSQSYTQMGDSIAFVNNNFLRAFNMTTESMLSLQSSLPIGSVNAPCVASDDRYIFVMGGEDQTVTDDGKNTFQIYDTFTNAWYTGNAMNQKRQHFSCNISPDKQYLYVFGGSYEDSSCTLFCSGTQKIIQSAEKIDISNMADVLSLSTYWDFIETFHMRSNQYFSRSIVDEKNGLIYTIGGRDLNAAGDDRIQIIDPKYDLSVLSTYTLNYGRSSPNVIMVNQIIYVFGGFTGSGTTNEMDTFEVSNQLIFPTYEPTTHPTFNPSVYPTTANPTATYNPTVSPSDYPTTYPSNIPSSYPSNIPTNNPITKVPTTKTPTNTPTNAPFKEGSVPVKTTYSIYTTSMGRFNNIGNDSDNSGVIIGSVVGGFALLCCIVILLVIVVYNQMKIRKENSVMHVQSESMATIPTTSPRITGIEINTDFGDGIHGNLQQQQHQQEGVELPPTVPEVAITPGVNNNDIWNDSDDDSDKSTKGATVQDNNSDNLLQNKENDELVVQEINHMDETNETLK